MVQHVGLFDFVALSGTQDGRAIEYVDHLHEHFVDPVVVRDGRYRAPTGPGAGARMRPESVKAYAFPKGAVWAGEDGIGSASAGWTVNRAGSTRDLRRVGRMES
jgi:L-fuconate dehydratase